EIQNEMKKTFEENLTDFFSLFIREKHLEEAIKKTFSLDIDSISFSCFNPNFSLNENPDFTKIKFINPITSENFLFFLDEVVNHCKYLTFETHSNAKTIDISKFSNEINIRTSTLKNLLIDTLNTKFHFNYINKKNIKISFISRMFNELNFSHQNPEQRFLMNFSIPKKVISLLLMPKRYSKLKRAFILQIKGNYTLRMYELLEEHIKKKTLELTKEEFFDFFTIPNSYRKKTHLMNKMINPTLKELEEITGIKAQVEFYPKHNWHTLTLTFKRIQVISNSKKLSEKTLKLIPELNSHSDKLNSTVKKMMRNIYVSRAWNSSAESSIKKLIHSEGEEFTIKVLKSVYENLKTDVKKSLSLYIQGVVKKMKEVEIEVI
ncbi:MAG: replication initiation protein, partial [Fusobacteriaceae bacterium]